MPTYAIGDIQGCFDEFINLLDIINFNNKEDILWFTGDLVNRGHSSLSVLRYIKSLGEKHQIVLGNHDLHLLALAYGVSEFKKLDTLDEILNAPDKNDLIDWLRSKPLMVFDAQSDYALVHAGIYPLWNIEKALMLAKEVAYILKNEPFTFLKSLYGNEPALWQDELEGMPRLRCITNYFTRMRYCLPDGRLDFNYKGPIDKKPASLIPWFDFSNRLNAKNKIIFGHWASLGGIVTQPNLFALDTGCVWGNTLTAMRLADCKRFSVPAKNTHLKI